MDYIQIRKDSRLLYGGDQGCFPEKKLKGYGCGLVASADVSLLLSDSSNHLDWEEYERYIRSIRKYFLVFPRLGMNGWFLSLGINLIFYKKHLPYRAHWRIHPVNSRSKADMENMLKDGIPVILAAGPNFPNWFGKEGVSLYRANGKGNLQKVNSFHQHFVTVTAMEGDDMTISSWGKEYHMRWGEFYTYARKKSIFFFTNYLKIWKIGKKT